MRVYLAAAYERQEEMQGVRDILTAFGNQVTSTWIDRAGEPAGGLGAAHLAEDPMAGVEFARIDLMDIDAAEAVISFTGVGSRGGRQVDYGFALGRGKYLIGVGPREHIFHTLAAEWYQDWTGLVMAITGRPPISALYFLHPDPAHATDELPRVTGNGAPAGPDPKTAWWPFASSGAEATLPGDEDARAVAAKVMGPEQPPGSRPGCTLCDTDMHRCPGCGEPVSHSQVACESCRRANS